MRQSETERNHMQQWSAAQTSKNAGRKYKCTSSVPKGGAFPSSLPLLLHLHVCTSIILDVILWCLSIRIKFPALGKAPSFGIPSWPLCPFCWTSYPGRSSCRLAPKPCWDSNSQVVIHCLHRTSHRGGIETIGQFEAFLADWHHHLHLTVIVGLLCNFQNITRYFAYRGFVQESQKYRKWQLRKQRLKDVGFWCLGVAWLTVPRWFKMCHEDLQWHEYHLLEQAALATEI